MTLLKSGILATTFVIAFSARAQEIQPGVHGGISIPMGDLADALDDRPGITLGGHLGIYYGNGHEVRPRVDFTHYRGGHVPSGGSFDKNTINAWGLGVDYLYYTARQPTGLYLTGGLGHQWWDVSPKHGSDKSHSALSVGMGAGYRFNRDFMLEGRFTTGEFRSDDGQAHAIQAVASMRF